MNHKASPKDDFSLPHIDLLVDSTTSNSMLSFMDGFSRVMSFGLKNAKATYQRATTTLFHDMMHREVEVYVNDMIVKSEIAFENIKGYLLSPPVLVSPMSGRPLLLYLPVSDITLGYPLRYLFDKPALTGRLMRWLVILSEFDIQYVSQKSIKRSIVANHLVSLSISEMEVFGESNLVLRQIQGDWRTRDVKLRLYNAYLKLVVRRFDDLRYTHLPRAQNQFVDALATLASSVDIPTDVVIRPLLIESRGLHNQGSEGIEAVFMICGETLCRRSVDCMLLLCLNRASTDRVMREVHAGACGPHMGGHMLARKIMRTELHTLTSPWPFSVWGIDIIGKISLKSSSCHEFILVAIDYFTNTFPIGVLADSCPLNAP
ncbi:hypothetical protein CK203_081428 [Vitis vinifera]|uniref:RNase H type-1 domain-containing protein n=1 Tax=Vitis vinifera TaxID=29760 RepID=A0A438DG50_VITVI|nr:hypothetical protein CK203_081428 [Vitis vinifera]